MFIVIEIFIAGISIGGMILPVYEKEHIWTTGVQGIPRRYH